MEINQDGWKELLYPLKTDILERLRIELHCTFFLSDSSCQQVWTCQQCSKSPERGRYRDVGPGHGARAGAQLTPSVTQTRRDTEWLLLPEGSAPVSQFLLIEILSPDMRGQNIIHQAWLAELFQASAGKQGWDQEEAFSYF